ncbi:MAG TPA: VanZ family protein [Firmicutes bacterium]|nr:VanZ family protein [Bacillota bacterium]
MTRAEGRRFRRALFTLLTVLYVGLIYGNSLQSGADSSALSRWATALLQEGLSLFGWQGTVTETFVRKAAHFAEYAGLGVLLMVTLRMYTPRLLAHLFIPLFIGLLVPVSDEFLQLFVPGRAGMVQDVVLDFAGLLAGLTPALLALLPARKRRSGNGASAGTARPGDADGPPAGRESFSGKGTKKP